MGMWFCYYTCPHVNTGLLYPKGEPNKESDYTCSGFRHRQAEPKADTAWQLVGGMGVVSLAGWFGLRLSQCSIQASIIDH